MGCTNTGCLGYLTGQMASYPCTALCKQAAGGIVLSRNHKCRAWAVPHHTPPPLLVHRPCVPLRLQQHRTGAVCCSTWRLLCLIFTSHGVNW